MNRLMAERAARTRVRAEMAARKPKGGKPKRAKKDPVAPGDVVDDDEDEEDLEELMEGPKKR